MRGTRLFERALEIPRVQEILGHLSLENQLLQLQICYHCVAREVMATFRATEYRIEVSPMEALLVALEMKYSGDIEFFEEDDGVIRATLSVSK